MQLFLLIVLVGREGFEPSTIGLKVRDLRSIYLFFITFNRGVRCLKCSTVHNGAALSPAKLPQQYLPHQAGFRRKTYFAIDILTYK